MRTSQNNIITLKYIQGRDARDLGHTRKMNPYPPKGTYATAWESGWVVRDQEISEAQNKRVDKSNPK